MERGRKIDGVCYTIPELITQERNLEAGTRYFKTRLKHAAEQGYSGDMQMMAAFRAYNAGNVEKGLSKATLSNIGYVKSAMDYYQKCKNHHRLF